MSDEFIFKCWRYLTWKYIVMVVKSVVRSWAGLYCYLLCILGAIEGSTLMGWSDRVVS